MKNVKSVDLTIIQGEDGGWAVRVTNLNSNHSSLAYACSSDGELVWWLVTKLDLSIADVEEA